MQVEIDGKTIWQGGHGDVEDILLRAYGDEQVRMGAQLADMDGTGVRCGAIPGYTEHIPKINLHKL